MFTADIATVSTRGQVAIPADIRSALGLKEGDKVLFVAHDNEVTLRKVGLENFLKMTEPFRKMKKKIKESEVVDLIHDLRQRRRARHERPHLSDVLERRVAQRRQATAAKRD